MHASALKAPLFQNKTKQNKTKKPSLSFSALGNSLGGFGGNVGNSWALGGSSEGGEGGSGRLKSESGG